VAPVLTHRQLQAPRPAPRRAHGKRSCPARARRGRPGRGTPAACAGDDRACFPDGRRADRGLSAGLLPRRLYPHGVPHRRLLDRLPAAQRTEHRSDEQKRQGGVGAERPVSETTESEPHEMLRNAEVESARRTTYRWAKIARFATLSIVAPRRRVARDLGTGSPRARCPRTVVLPTAPPCFLPMAMRSEIMNFVHERQGSAAAKRLHSAYTIRWCLQGVVRNVLIYWCNMEGHGLHYFRSRIKGLSEALEGPKDPPQN
jgi:hypothetical protein